jgi:hypothetical protein
VPSLGLLYDFWRGVSSGAGNFAIEVLTVGKIDHVEPLRAREIFELGQPQVDCLGCMSSAMLVSCRQTNCRIVSQMGAYRWNMIHCAVVAMLS